jgi:hypothetical protein
LIAGFIRVIQVLIPFGLTLGCLAFLAAIIGLMSRRIFLTSVLFASLFAFLSCESFSSAQNAAIHFDLVIFSMIGVTVFATEALVYVERLRLRMNENSRRWGMWLVLPHLILSFVASLFFVLASIFHWCNHRHMRVTGILSHSVDKYGGSVFKAPSDRYIRWLDQQ